MMHCTICPRKMFSCCFQDITFVFWLKEMLERCFRNTETEQICVFFNLIFLHNIKSLLYVLRTWTSNNVAMASSQSDMVLLLFVLAKEPQNKRTAKGHTEWQASRSGAIILIKSKITVESWWACHHQRSISQVHFVVYMVSMCGMAFAVVQQYKWRGCVHSHMVYVKEVGQILIWSTFSWSF